MNITVKQARELGVVFVKGDLGINLVGNEIGGGNWVAMVNSGDLSFDLMTIKSFAWREGSAPAEMANVKVEVSTPQSSAAFNPKWRPHLPSMIDEVSKFKPFGKSGTLSVAILGDGCDDSNLDFKPLGKVTTKSLTLGDQSVSDSFASDGYKEPLSETLKQMHECGDHGKALEGYSERVKALEDEVEKLKQELLIVSGDAAHGCIST